MTRVYCYRATERENHQRHVQRNPPSCQPPAIGSDLQVRFICHYSHAVSLARVCVDCCVVCVSNCTDLPPHLERIKQQANDAFARQQWTQAIQLYSMGIHKASRNAMLYGNRAAAYMKRKWYVNSFTSAGQSSECVSVLTFSCARVAR